MKLRRLLLAPLVLTSLVGIAIVAQEKEAAAAKMTAAAEKWVASLTPEQKKKAAFAFDDTERTRWFFVPLQENGKPLRKGLTMEDMSAEQKELAKALIAAGTSSAGYTKASTIM